MYDMMMGPQALFTLFGMPVYPFALMVTLAAVCAVFMAVKRAKAIRVGQGPALLFAVLGIPLAVIFGRLIFCLCRIVTCWTLAWATFSASITADSPSSA